MLADPSINRPDITILKDVLTPEQSAVLFRDLLPNCSEISVIIPELLYRKWLTPFQASMFLSGRAQHLRYGSYVLKDRLGDGGMGRIYYAEHVRLGKPAAIKILRKNQAHNPQSMKRFFREIRAIAALRHQYIVHAFDADITNDRIYFAMEYVPGVDLGKYVKSNGVLSWETVTKYALQIAVALQYIHALGLIHRDIKPENIQVTLDGSMVKLLDLGLARYERWELDEDRGITQQGRVVGTPNFISPEQIVDSHHVDIRSDLYSLGCTMYMMLAGHAPFDSGDVVSIMNKQLHETARPIEEIRADIPKSLAEIIAKLMAKSPQDRYQDPSELIDQLRPIVISTGDTLTDAVTASHPTMVPAHEETENRTVDIPIEELKLYTLTPETPRSFKSTVYEWLGRLHWVVATLIAGIAMGFVIRGL